MIQRHPIAGRVAASFGAVLVALLAAGCNRGSAETPPGLQRAARTKHHFVETLPAMLIADEAVLRHDFRVLNDTEETLRFEEVTHSCGCTDSTLEQETLAPGEETVLQLTVDLRDRSGQQFFDTTLKPAEGSAWRYRLKVAVYPRLECRPRQLHLGTIEPNAGARGELVVVARSRPGEPPATVTAGDGIEGMAVSNLGTVAEEEESGLLVARTTFAIEVPPSSVPGRHEKLIEVVAAADGESRTIRAPVAWTVRSVFELSPSRVFFGSAKGPAPPPARRVRLARLDGEPLRIKGVAASHPGILVAADVGGAAAASHSLEVTVDPARVGASLWGEVTVETDHPSQPTIAFAVSAIGDLAVSDPE